MKVFQWVSFNELKMIFLTVSYEMMRCLPRTKLNVDHPVHLRRDKETSKPLALPLLTTHPYLLDGLQPLVVDVLPELHAESTGGGVLRPLKLCGVQA